MRKSRPVPGSIYVAFTEVVHARAHETALIGTDHSVTYAELDALATRIAGGLAERGVEVGGRVGLALERSIELVATMLAVFRLGAVIVPVSPSWRGQIAPTLACLVDEAELGALVAAPALRAPPVADATLALALYTSGSTGAPKAVLLDHAALLWRLHALALALPYRPGDVCCHRTPPTFIDAYAEIFGPLLAGVPAVVLPHPLAIADLVVLVEQAAVTRLLLVPSLLALLLDARPTLPDSLRLVMTSGEPLSNALANRFFRASSAKLANIYGSTEVCGDATIAVIASGEAVTIGRPLAGVALRIAGDERELQIAGPILARGYDQPELTTARFVREGTTTWFRTGDRARRLADGRYTLVGRIDDQVKIHGVRVELGEVETALLAQPGVTAACAAVHEGRLVAGVVGAPVDPARLSLAVVPSTIAVLPALPMSAHGKRDRGALAGAVLAERARLAEVRAAEVDRAIVVASGEIAVPAVDGVVARITAWFAQLASSPAATADDELAAIGGDSLARLGLLVELERAGWHVEHADLPSPLTPRTLAAVLQTREIAVPTADPATPFAVTDFQRVMVLDSLANRGTPMWVDQLAYTIRTTVDPARFAEAWRAEIAAQPALRTRFVVDDTVRQIVDAEAAFSMAHLELAALSLDAYRTRVKAEEWTRISLHFALERVAPYAVCLVTGADRCELIFTYHHAILDGESARRVLRNVLARYAGHEVAPARESFRAFCERPSGPTEALRTRLAGHVVSAPAAVPRATGMGDLAWRLFHRLLAIRSFLAAWRMRRRSKRLPLSHTPSSYAGGDIASQPLPTLVDTAIAAWSRTERTTATAAWATAFALHLARERDTHDVVFGVVVSGRDGRSADTVGMLANCLPLRFQLDPTASIAATVQAVTSALAELDAVGRAPLLELGLDPRVFLDTMLTTWRFPTAAAPALPIDSGRGLTMTAPHTALIVSPTELAVGAASFHRTDRVRREILGLIDALLTTAPSAPLSTLLAITPHEGGLAVAHPGL